MMNRERLGFWVRIVAIALAVFFVGSSVLLGLGTNVQYNLLDVFGGSSQAQQQQQVNQTPDINAQISDAREDLNRNPGDPDNVTDLAGLLYQNGQYDEAVRVLEEGRERSPNDEEIPNFLGQIRYEQAQTAAGGEQDDLYRQAGDAFAATTEADPDDEDAYLAAGDAYEQAGETALAIQYYNGYLDEEPEGEQARQVEGRISALLEGGGSTTGGG